MSFIPLLPTPKEITHLVKISVDASTALTKAIVNHTDAVHRHAAALEEQNRSVVLPSSIELFAGGQ